MKKSISLRLYDEWMQENPEMTKKVMSQDECDIEPEFMCFAQVYEPLSKMIPKHWTVIDIGCAYAPQCLYFKKHRNYVGIEPSRIEHFMTENTGILHCSVKEWMDIIDVRLMNLDRTFAIMSYVPADEYSYFLVKTTFKNLFVYYPSGEPIRLKK